MAPQLELDADATQAGRVIEALTTLGQHDRRASSREQFRRRNSAAGGTDDHHAAPDHRERVITHAITAASALSD
jgi:hypothetical protein